MPCLNGDKVNANYTADERVECMDYAQNGLSGSMGIVFSKTAFFPIQICPTIALWSANFWIVIWQFKIKERRF